MAGVTDRPDLPLAFRKAEELEKLINTRLEEVFENDTTVEMELRRMAKLMAVKHSKYSLHKLVIMINRLEASNRLMEAIWREGKRLSHRTEDRIKTPLRRLLGQVEAIEKKSKKAIESVRAFLAGV